jgi:ribosomal protein S18 acetylase RimI-like enzyme
MTETVKVRPALSVDRDVIAAFNAAMARETEGKELDLVTVTRGVEKALADPSRGRYYVAELEGRAAGCLLLTREWSDWRDGWYWWIQSVFVTPQARGRGAYTALHEQVRREAIAAGDVAAIRLYVEKHNAAAQRTYHRLGMIDAGYLVYEERLKR